MNFFSGQSGGYFENTHLNINCNNNSHVSNNPTPGGPSLSPTNSSNINTDHSTNNASSTVTIPLLNNATTSTPIVTPNPTLTTTTTTAKTPTESNESSIFYHRNVTSPGDIRVPELSPNNPEMSAEQMKLVSSYFYNKYRKFWRSDLSSQQNVIAMQHFEKKTLNAAPEGHSDSLSNFCINNQHLINYKFNELTSRKSKLGSNMNNESTNMNNQCTNIGIGSPNTNNQKSSVSVNTDFVKKLWFTNMINQYPEQLEKSFKYALSIYPKNHNNNMSHTPPSPFPTSIGLPGGMPKKRQQRKRNRNESENDDADDDDEDSPGIMSISYSLSMKQFLLIFSKKYIYNV